MHARKTAIKAAPMTPYTAMAIAVLVIGSLGGIAIGIIAGMAAYWIASRNE